MTDTLLSDSADMITKQSRELQQLRFQVRYLEIEARAHKLRADGLQLDLEIAQRDLQISREERLGLRAKVQQLGE